MKYFKVKIGYGRDDFISIDETELELALRASGNGKMAVFKEGAISGNNIMAILPDWNKEMGWNRDYQLTGEDYELIGNEKQNIYRNFIENKTNQIKGFSPRGVDNPLIETKKLVGKFNEITR